MAPQSTPDGSALGFPGYRHGCDTTTGWANGGVESILSDVAVCANIDGAQMAGIATSGKRLATALHLTATDFGYRNFQMSRWADNFDGLTIHKTVESALEALGFETDEMDSNAASEHRRLVKAFNFLKNILDGIDPELSPDALLNNVANHLNQHVVAQISNYVSNKNVQHLTQANDQFTSQIPTIFQIAGTIRPQESMKIIRRVEAAYDKFRETIEKTKNEFEKVSEEKATEISDLEAKTSEISTSLENLQEATESQISTWQSEFTEAQTARAEEYSEAQIERGKEYDEALREFKSASEKDRIETTNRHDQELGKSFTTYKDNITDKSKSIAEMHASIKKLHGLATNDSVAGGYKKGADDERQAAFWWSLVSMGCYGLIMLWVLLKGKLGFGVANVDGLDWPLIVTTISVSAVAFVAAQFAGRQSRVRRMNEQRMRWFSFEIAAIDPFISSLPIEEQQKLKQQLSEKLFGQDRVIEEKPSKVRGLDPESIKSLTQPITEAIKAAKG
ncbi:hypothetical protein OEZ49_03250 [Ruegeria sp. WL0004]|uniref:Uncharacterized protein n=1 Tax=Ruegeria marisflavi TaxID=2984152 RepID=A0ABT2WLK6_9RHOB|nr:hypothetical protein [Ruegeria sp. WL0004]MCU9836777.1 hypothetical protein [Ruegeria sp. WL0004]